MNGILLYIGMVIAQISPSIRMLQRAAVTVQQVK